MQCYYTFLRTFTLQRAASGQFPQVCEVRVVGAVCENAEQTGLSTASQTLYACVTCD